ncbi:G-protein coupled receptor Mth2-like [Linepithema humile]|uniref:G-protein coupled receptor Mth2-like n=1 Tax=Linepithema humile TaxID=83485 RepID=UPI0006236AC0|nr:PREDICTED: G-protein coupled receptor Mth2-like [Linepithema humile]
MCRRSLAFLFCAFLLIVSSLGEDKEYWKNFTNDNEQRDNSTMPQKLNANQDDLAHNLRENSGIDTASNESKNFTHELRVKSNENDDACNNTCQLIKDHCVFWQDYFVLLQWPNVTSSNANLKRAFKVIANATCKEEHFSFNKYTNNENAMFFDNGSSPQLRRDIFISRISDCLLAEYRAWENNVTFCDFTIYTTKETMWIYLIIFNALMIVSALGLLMTFIVYSVCPELRNLHGYALRSYVISFFFIYSILLIESVALYIKVDLNYFSCLGIAFIFYFFSIASFLWQSVICFDIFWTFGGFRSTQRSVKQSQRKMYVMCSIYAWGSTCGFIIILAIINFVSNISKNIQPKMCLNILNLADDAINPYFNTFMSIITVGNIGCFIFTILKIVCIKKDVDHHLRDSESNCNDNNKQRFIVYLKLFILMDIITSLRWTITAVWKYGSFNVAYPLHILYALQGSIVFISFVCNKKILQHLRKQCASCKNSGPFYRKSKNNTYVRPLRTAIDMRKMVLLKVSKQANYHRENSSEDITDNTTM